MSKNPVRNRILFKCQKACVAPALFLLRISLSKIFESIFPRFCSIMHNYDHFQPYLPRFRDAGMRPSYKQVTDIAFRFPKVCSDFENRQLFRQFLSYNLQRVKRREFAHSPPLTTILRKGNELQFKNIHSTSTAELVIAILNPKFEMNRDGRIDRKLIQIYGIEVNLPSLPMDTIFRCQIYAFTLLKYP